MSQLAEAYRPHWTELKSLLNNPLGVMSRVIGELAAKVENAKAPKAMCLMSMGIVDTRVRLVALTLLAVN